RELVQQPRLARAGLAHQRQEAVAPLGRVEDAADLPQRLPASDQRRGAGPAPGSAGRTTLHHAPSRTAAAGAGRPGSRLHGRGAERRGTSLIARRRDGNRPAAAWRPRTESHTEARTEP